MKCVAGIMYDPGTDPFKGYLCWDEEVVTEVGKGSPPIEPMASGIITPFFINGHTHVGDSCFYGTIDTSLSLEDIVVPPHGLKHQLLSTTPRDRLIEGMRSSLVNMASNGTGNFLDFREGGLPGLQQLEEARQSIKEQTAAPHIFSRPIQNKYDRTEIEALLERSSGLGISAMLDWDPGELEKVARDVRNAGKLLALHVSETVRENIDTILDLKPDILVHLTSASRSDLERVADAEVQVAVCPRANSLFGLRPDIVGMMELRIPLSLGTDNLMFTQPDMREEMRFTLDLLKAQCGSKRGDDAAESILCMAVTCLRKPLNVKSGVCQGESARFMVLPSPVTEPKTAALSIIHGGTISLMVNQ